MQSAGALARSQRAALVRLQRRRVAAAGGRGLVGLAFQVAVDAVAFDADAAQVLLEGYS